MSGQEGQGPRAALVGCGRWGRNHARSLAAIGALAAVVDADPARAAAEGADRSVPARSFEDVLADPEIGAVVFALPPSQNLPLGRRALAAGKHLFVEKPLALSVAEGEALCADADAAGRILAVGHILLFHPAYRRLAALVADGRLGRLLSITSTRLDLGRIRREEDALWALAPHDVSMILGLASAEPVRVRAGGGRHTHPAIADDASVSLDFADGLRADIRVSWLNPFKEQRLVCVGTDAMAVFDDREDWARKLVLHSYRIADDGRTVAVTRADPSPVTLEPAEPLKAELRAFLHAAATGIAPPNSGREGLRVLRVLERSSSELAGELAAGSG